MEYSILFAVTCISVALFSCNNEPKKTTEDVPTVTASDTTATMHVMIPNTACYAAVTGKDSFKLKLEKFPNVVTGSLVYKFHAKDSNTGTIDGTLSGDTLLADYTFTSEGKKSVRQVVFLVKDSTATEGYGSMEEKDGKLVFKSLKKIEFVTGAKMVKVDCTVE